MEEKLRYPLLFSSFNTWGIVGSPSRGNIKTSPWCCFTRLSRSELTEHARSRQVCRRHLAAWCYLPALPGLAALWRLPLVLRCLAAILLCYWHVYERERSTCFHSVEPWSPDRFSLLLVSAWPHTRTHASQHIKNNNVNTNVLPLQISIKKKIQLSIYKYLTQQLAFLVWHAHLTTFKIVVSLW